MFGASEKQKKKEHKDGVFDHCGLPGVIALFWRLGKQRHGCRNKRVMLLAGNIKHDRNKEPVQLSRAHIHVRRCFI
jgi:hypothetical protein